MTVYLLVSLYICVVVNLSEVLSGKLLKLGFVK